MQLYDEGAFYHGLKMNERNYSIDVLKFVCAVLVVVLHTDFEFHDVILPLTRCAVPCFLMISGFLLYSVKGIGNERLKRNIKYVFHCLVWSTLLFFAFRVYMSCGKITIPSKKQWINFVVFNDNPFGGHLWYLGAYLYVLVIMLVIDKYRLWKPLLWITPMLLLV